LNPDDLSFFNSLTAGIWIFKPIFGFVADSYYLCGTKRKSYLILFSILQTLAWLGLSIMASSFWQAVLAQGIINVCSGFVNVIGEAIMVEISNDDAKNKSEDQDENERDNT
jgi:MFS family permease